MEESEIHESYRRFELLRSWLGATYTQPAGITSALPIHPLRTKSQFGRLVAGNGICQKAPLLVAKEYMLHLGLHQETRFMIYRRNIYIYMISLSHIPSSIAP